ncbi:MAG: DNA polymerase III subunit beta [Gammaproteobacteria bacterium]|nr:DNA polymerase III subunit beta [Gammaproteobacteria bacterium]MCW8839354.1 DNA polymerase III subunit beta [Gammaproteobacteria bacterium]MCW8927787.1 DNA polymerase III subunit beta [Gammaproteobacteria bacterium]MCW8957473.1 DNA polymerase III subunit beta [Gammaproteobacteria bacterium]MCW8971949.1 DNA polymerase III subunit beta [Gammaproteobacteria bacterium]
MKFKISREALLKPLQVVSGVVEKRQTLPILSNVLVCIESDRLTMTGTDLEVELTASAPLQGAESGEITLPARKFMDICKSLPDGAELDISIDAQRALIRSGKSRFTLATLPANDFPATEKVTGAREYSLQQSILKHLIEQTHFCMANQDVRYYLNGLLLELRQNAIRAVATDGHRLALSEASLDLVPGDINQIILPRKGVSELSRLLSDGDQGCNIQLNANFIRVDLGEIVFTSKLIDGRFPDYDRVIPKGGDKIVKANRENLRQGLLRASILSNEKYRGVRLNFADNMLRATVNNPEQEEAQEELDVSYSGEEIEIGFNVSYLVDALNAIKQDEVEIILIDANSSCLIHGEGDDSSRYVVMPMRL